MPIITDSKPVDHSRFILGPDPRGQTHHAVMPLNRVHLVSGGSGAGKTTLLMQMWKAAKAGQPFLGYETQWHPSVYVAFDRGPSETAETMQRVGLVDGIIPYCMFKVPLPPQFRHLADTRLEQVVRDVLDAYPGTKVIYMDAFFILAPHGQINDYLLMAEWLQRAGRLCEDYDITIVGIVHSAKQRKGMEILDPRYSSTGSVANGGFTSCQVVVERVYGDGNEAKRKVHIFPRNAGEVHIEMMTDEHGLIVLDEEEADNRRYLIEHYLVNTCQGIPMELKKIKADLSKHDKMSMSSLQRALRELVDEGRVAKVGKGLYAPVVPAEVANGGH